MQWIELDADGRKIPNASQDRRVTAHDDTEEFYDALGLYPTATAAEVRTAYLELARLSHPDLLPEAERAAAEEHMKWINRAYGALQARLNVDAAHGDSKGNRADRP